MPVLVLDPFELCLCECTPQRLIVCVNICRAVQALDLLVETVHRQTKALCPGVSGINIVQAPLLPSLQGELPTRILILLLGMLELLDVLRLVHPPQGELVQGDLAVAIGLAHGRLIFAKFGDASGGHLSASLPFVKRSPPFRKADRERLL